MLDIEKPAEEYKNTPEELEANEFASVTIISKSDYQQLQKKINHTTVMQYAKRLSLHPSLIYGRLCRDGTLTHKEMSNFAVKLHR